MKVVVIGGVAAGMSAASKIKRTDKNAEITVYEKGKHLSYGACGIPYYVTGADDDYRKLIARTKEDFDKAGINSFLMHEAVKVDTNKKQIMVKNQASGSLFLDTYDKLLIATGASPIVPPVSGTALDGVYTIKTLDAAKALREEVVKPDVKEIVVVGGGYIGVEAAETLAEKGKNVRIIELTDRILQNYDAEITQMAQQELGGIGVQLNLGERVLEIAGKERVDSVTTDKGTYPADIVILAVGVRPNTGFLKGSGIALGLNGAVAVDREMRTNVLDVYAAGDCAEVYHLAMQENVYLPLATTANKCGRMVGSNILGKHDKFAGTMGSACIKVGSLELAKTGLSEADAKRLTIDYTTVLISAPDHAHYYPGHTPVWIKLICEKSTKKLLGAQAAGKKNAVLRIGMFALAIQNGMTARELGMADICYAPPFAPVWDAVHIACNAVK